MIIRFASSAERPHFCECGAARGGGSGVLITGERQVDVKVDERSLVTMRSGD